VNLLLRHIVHVTLIKQAQYEYDAII